MTRQEVERYAAEQARLEVDLWFSPPPPWWRWRARRQWNHRHLPSPPLRDGEAGELPNWADRHTATLTEAEVKEIVEAWRTRLLVRRHNPRRSERI